MGLFFKGQLPPVSLRAKTLKRWVLSMNPAGQGSPGRGQLFFTSYRG